MRIEEGWKEALSAELEKPYFALLRERIHAEYSRRDVPCYPPAAKVFAAFDTTPFRQVKVVIIGQDPYHGPGQANGLAFSVNPGIQIPPSLRNIYQEIHDDIGADIPATGDLSKWARQGVLLLNSSLSVRQHQPKSHSGLGWEEFTDAAVTALNSGRENIVFLLWGSDAIRKGNGIDRNRHLVLTAPHPSPLSAYRGFFGCRHFSKANEYLVAHGIEPIDWRI